MRLIFSISFIFFLGNLLLAQPKNQTSLLILIQPCLNEKPLLLEEEIVYKDKPLSIETLKFYLSNFSLLKSGKVVWEETNSYYLVDASVEKSMEFLLNFPVALDFDWIQFNVGIDSITNVSGVMGGDLDPTKGMYWAWNSGYINFKLEGSSPLCPGRNKEFQFHLGGYMAPFQSVQTVQIKAPAKKEINIKMAILKFLEQIDLHEQYKIMSPGIAAQKLSQITSTLFFIDDEK